MAIGKTDRLGLRVPDIGTLNWADEVNDNTEIISSILSNIELGNGVKFGCIASDGGVLQLDYTAGEITVDGIDFTVASGNKTATAIIGTETVQRNFLYVDSAGVVQISTTAPSGEYVLLAVADCDVTQITAVYDVRNLISDGINHIINGGFDIWQRATSQTSSGYGSDDRWTNTNSGTTKTNSRQTFALGQTNVAGNPKYFCRNVVSSVAGSANYCVKSQRIENLVKFSGKTIKLSFDAKADAGKDIATNYALNFGTGGTPSTTVNAAGTKHTLTTSWQRFEKTINIPSLTGETLGTDGNDYLQIGFWLDAGSTYDTFTDTLGQQSGTFDIANVKIEIGEIATSFESRPYAEELALCQRYCWVGEVGSGGYKYGVASDTFMFAVDVDFPVTMRVQPTITQKSAGTLENCSNLQSGDLDKDSFSLTVTVTSTGRFRYSGSFQIADAEL